MGSCFSSPREGGGGGGGGGRGGGRGGAGVTRSHELQGYNPVRYLSDLEVIRNPNCIVSRVHFVAQTILRNGGNHWTIYLQTSSDTAVRINMDPSDMLGARVPEHGYRGQMEIVHRDHAVTRNQEGLVTIPATRGHPVTHYIDAIIHAGNHEYDFTTVGRGCTGWILDQFHLFLQLNLIQPGFDILEDAINMEWSKGKPRRKWPATRGFYMRDTRGGGWGGSSGGRSAAGRSRGTSRR